MVISEDEYAEEMEEMRIEMTNKIFDIINDGEDDEGLTRVQKITESAEAVLYKKDGPLREIFLCTPTHSCAFMPLNYALAELLSPEDTELKAYASDRYSVMVDERRNIVFDNCSYFRGQSASVTLENARNMGPNLAQMT